MTERCRFRTEESVSAARSLEATVVVQFRRPDPEMSRCLSRLSPPSVLRSHLPHRVPEADDGPGQLGLLSGLQRGSHHGGAHPELVQ